MLVPPHQVNRVIARPFNGPPGAYARTPNRRDYAVDPPPSILDEIAATGVPIHAVGKICDIYCGHGIVDSVRVPDNTAGVQEALRIADSIDHGVVFVNLNDFDSKYGHRRDVRGYADALERLDAMLPALIERIRPGDGLIFTADHGCDPDRARQRSHARIRTLRRVRLGDGRRHRRRRGDEPSRRGAWRPSSPG